MANGRKQAEIAAAAVLRILETNPGDAGIQSVSEIIELALHDAAREQEKRELKRIAEVQESAHAHLSRLLNASPAVIYCRVASGDFEPTFVSESIHRLFGCPPREYLENPYLWRDRVHPDDVPRINAWVDKMFESDERSIEYRIRRTDSTYFWVNDQQQ
ncbi:MAG: PAS domain-containing protein, partial [Methyloceanibacter sp.]